MYRYDLVRASWLPVSLSAVVIILAQLLGRQTDSAFNVKELLKAGVVE